MALADRNSDSRRHRITNSTELASISSSFAEGKHVDLKAFPGEAAILYQIQKLEEDIDELRRYVTNEATGSAIDATTLSAWHRLPTSDPRSIGKLWNNRGVVTVSAG